MLRIILISAITSYIVSKVYDLLKNMEEGKWKIKK